MQIYLVPPLPLIDLEIFLGPTALKITRDPLGEPVIGSLPILIFPDNEVFLSAIFLRNQKIEN